MNCVIYRQEEAITKHSDAVGYGAENMLIQRPKYVLSTADMASIFFQIQIIFMYLKFWIASKDKWINKYNNYLDEFLYTNNFD